MERSTDVRPPDVTIELDGTDYEIAYPMVETVCVFIQLSGLAANRFLVSQCLVSHGISSLPYHHFVAILAAINSFVPLVDPVDPVEQMQSENPDWLTPEQHSQLMNAKSEK